MRQTVASAAAVAIAAAVSFGIVGVSGGSEEAEASYGDTRACVTEREAKRIKLNQTKQRVHKITDGKGRRTFFDGKDYPGDVTWEAREYRFCGEKWDTALRIDYIDKRVAAIDALWHYLD